MLRVQWLIGVPSSTASSGASTALSSAPPPSLSFLLSLLPPDESAASTRFHQPIDRMRAAISRCAVRAFLSLATGHTRWHTTEVACCLLSVLAESAACAVLLLC